LQENIKASFFMVGYLAKKHTEAVKAMQSDGHDIGSHGYSHLRMGALDRDRIIKDIEKCDKVLKNITGVKPDLFRPTYGDYSNNVVGVAR
jgi:peptidoglycan/xylan/chitin deacetylase (PgdA/CDA1 family)